MTGQHAELVLKLMGKTPSPSGILLPQDMPTAMALLEASANLQASSNEEKQEAHPPLNEAEDDPISSEESVSLHQRIWPLIDMMKRCLAADTEIVWGV